MKVVSKNTLVFPLFFLLAFAACCSAQVGYRQPGKLAPLTGMLLPVGASSNLSNFWTSRDSDIAEFLAAGDLDTTFGSSGTVLTTINQGDAFGTSVAIQTDGKIVAAGWADLASNSDFAVIRYNSDGSLDPAFGSGGKVVTDIQDLRNEGQAVAIQQDGKIIVAGIIEQNAVASIALIRYNPDGSLDSTFGNQGKLVVLIGTFSVPSSVAIQSDGKIVIAGIVGGEASAQDFGVVRLNSDGSFDSSFGVGGKVITAISSGYDQLFGLDIQIDGKIVVAGYTAGTAPGKFALVRYATNGTLDATFGSGGIVVTQIGSQTAVAYSVSVQRDGKIVAGGVSRDVLGNTFFTLCRYTSNGQLDGSFGNSGIVVTSLIGITNNSLHDLVIQNDQKIIAIGEAFMGSSQYDFAVVRYHTNGTLDSSFGNGGKVTTPIGTGNDAAIAGVRQQDGNLVLVGESNIGSVGAFGLARYLTFDCINAINPTNENFGSSASLGSISVSAPSQCTWTAQSRDRNTADRILYQCSARKLYFSGDCRQQ